MPKEEEETTTTTTFETTTYTTTPYISTTTINYECSTNSDCDTKYGSGYYCDITDYGNYSCSGDVKGICRYANNNLRSKPDTAPFWISKNEMTSGLLAQNFCEALGKSLIALSDFNCSINTSSGTGHCENEIINAIYTAYGYHYAHVKSGSNWYRVSFGEGGSGKYVVVIV